VEKLLLTIRERLSKRQYLSESAVREAIVLPVLNILGWDIFDRKWPEHDSAFPSHSLESSRTATGQLRILGRLGQYPRRVKLSPKAHSWRRPLPR
jgi:hypothetical protein